MKRITQDKCAQQELFGAATQVSQSQSWLTARFGAPRLLSIGIHCLLVSIALIPWVSTAGVHPKFTETTIALYTPVQLTKPLPLPSHAGGGGGGGKHERTPASRGVLPRGADKQLVPPDPNPPKNPDPTLIVESTIVAPQLALRRVDLLNIGDPNGVVSPPSSGPGMDGGIGPGKGHGVGKGDGPGGIDGTGGGCCDGAYHIGGDVTAPTVVYRVDPEYSEEARRARHEGTVVLEAVVRKDGTVDVVHLVRSLGFGLDQNAIEALKVWRFRPGMRNGVPVDVTLNIEVRFNIR
jgi:protein TonB